MWNPELDMRGTSPSDTNFAKPSPEKAPEGPRASQPKRPRWDDDFQMYGSGVPDAFDMFDSPGKKQKTSREGFLSPEMNDIYRPLEENEFRYVVLKADRPKAAIRVAFIISDFNDPRNYEALSYVWGDQIHEDLIEVQHAERVVPFPVTKNLGSALRQLRDTITDRLLWIDALCINQADQQERSMQVAKMHQIFHGASNVCIWLGDQTSDSPAAMDFISQILDFSAHAKFISRKMKTRSLALSRLLARPWFSRRWVVQEMALARKATVHCGTKSIPWSDFADAVALFGIIREEVVKHLSPDQVYEIGEIHALGAASLVDISSNIYRKDHFDGHIQERLLNLESLLAKLPMFNVSQAHDAVYATITLGKDTFDNNTIPVDYTMSPTKLFARVTEYIIEKSGSLDIICRPWAPSHAGLTLPSWIPTVANYPYVRRFDGQYNRQNADSLVGRPENKRKPYNACDDVAANVSVLVDEDVTAILKSGGIHADFIGDVGDRCVNGNIPSGWTKMAGWHDRSSRAPPEFWRTLVADRGPDSENPPNWYGRACQHVFNQGGTDDLDTTKMVSALLSTDTRDFLQRVQSVTWGRKLFVTQHEKQPGIGPADCQAGDYICILYGCSVPVVLRPSGSKYRLIGECYVQGMMGGEAVKRLRQRTNFLGKNFEII